MAPAILRHGDASEIGYAPMDDNLERLLFPSTETAQLGLRGGTVGYAFLCVGESDDAELVMHLIAQRPDGYSMVPAQFVPDDMMERLKHQYSFLAHAFDTSFDMAAQLSALLSRQSAIEEWIRLVQRQGNTQQADDTDAEADIEKETQIKSLTAEACLTGLTQRAVQTRALLKGFEEIVKTLSNSAQLSMKQTGRVMVMMLLEVMEGMAAMEHDLKELWDLWVKK